MLRHSTWFKHIEPFLLPKVTGFEPIFLQSDRRFARLGEGPKAKNVLDTSDFDFEAIEMALPAGYLT